MVTRLVQLLHDESGVTTVEYALLLALVVVAAIAAWQGLGNTVQNTVSDSADIIANGTG